MKPQLSEHRILSLCVIGKTDWRDIFGYSFQFAAELADKPIRRPSKGRCGTIALLAMADGPYARCRLSCKVGSG